MNHQGGQPVGSRLESRKKGGEWLLKSTGIVRRVDETGRFVVPIELRHVYGIDHLTPLEIFTDGEHIVLRKYHPMCLFCGSSGEVTVFRGKTICLPCQTTLSQVGT